MRTRCRRGEIEGRVPCLAPAVDAPGGDALPLPLDVQHSDDGDRDGGDDYDRLDRLRPLVRLAIRLRRAQVDSGQLHREREERRAEEREHVHPARRKHRLADCM